jgi:hypothetical protein
MVMKRTIPCALLFFFGLALRCANFAVADGKRSEPQANSSLPHDSHGGMTVAADPYSDENRAKAKFGKANPVPAGILPVEVSFRNETAQPIHVNLNTIQLNVRFPGGRRQYVDRLTVGQVADAVAHPNGPAAPSQRRFPVGLSSNGDKKVDKLMDVLRPLSLDADIVPPMGTIHGFLFFNVSHDFSLVGRSSLYIPDVATVPSNKPLIFFEVALGAAAE